MTAVDAVGEFNDNAVEEQRFVLEIYDNIDGAVCYVLLSGLALYALYTFIRERFFIRKKYTLRLFILFFTLLNCLLLLGYTIATRNVYWNDFADTIGDMTTTVVSCFQFFFVCIWYYRASHAIDDEFESSPILSCNLFNVVFLVVIFCIYLPVGVYFLAVDQMNYMRIFQSIFTLSASAVFAGIGIYCATYTRKYVDMLNISREFYSVMKRTRYLLWVLAFCALVSAVLSLLSLLPAGRMSEYVSVMQTKYYSCHRMPCLVNFLLRVVFLVFIPNSAVCYLFSSPKERGLHLVYLNRAPSIEASYRRIS